MRCLCRLIEITLLFILAVLPQQSVAENFTEDPFIPLETFIEHQAPHWWPHYQAVQAALQDQQREDARLLLEALLRSHADDEAAYRLLMPRYLWLKPSPDCSVFEGLSETPEPWRTGIQRFCRYLSERREIVATTDTSTLHRWVQWLFGVKAQQVLLTEQALSDLEALQAQQTDSLILVGLVSLLMHLNDSAYWQIDNYWQRTARTQGELIYKKLFDDLAIVWFPAITVSENGAFGFQGANAQRTIIINRHMGINTISFSGHTPSSTGGGSGFSSSHFHAIETQRRQDQERYARMQAAVKQNLQNAQAAANNIQNTVNAQVQQHIKQEQQRIRQWHQDMHAQSVAEIENRQRALASRAEAERRIAAEQAEKRRQAQIAAEQAEKKRQAQIAAEQAEKKRQAQIAAEQAEKKRQAQIAAEQAEKKRQAQIAAEKHRLKQQFENLRDQELQINDKVTTMNMKESWSEVWTAIWEERLKVKQALQTLLLSSQAQSYTDKQWRLGRIQDVEESIHWLQNEIRRPNRKKAFDSEAVQIMTRIEQTLEALEYASDKDRRFELNQNLVSAMESHLSLLNGPLIEAFSPEIRQQKKWEVMLFIDALDQAVGLPGQYSEWKIVESEQQGENEIRLATLIRKLNQGYREDSDRIVLLEGMLVLMKSEMSQVLPREYHTRQIQMLELELERFRSTLAMIQEVDLRTTPLWSELQKDTEPPSFCEAGRCPDDFELNYDGQLLAASTFAAILPKAGLSWSEVAGKLIKPLNLSPGFFVMGLVFSTQSTSTRADRELLQETITYQGNDEHGQPAYTDSLGKTLEVVAMDRDSFTLPNGIKGTWLPQHGQPPILTEYPAGIPLEAGVYPLPEDKSLPINFSREADHQKGLILEHPGTGQRVLVYYSEIDGLHISSDGRITLDLFGGKRSMNPGAINLDTRAEAGIRGSALDLPVKANSVDEVITSNPFIPYEVSRTKSMMDWLPEAARVLKPGGEIIINGHRANPFTRLPDQKVLDTLNLEIVMEEEPLLSRFRDQEFFDTDGGNLRKDKMKSTVLRKREGS